LRAAVSFEEVGFGEELLVLNSCAWRVSRAPRMVIRRAAPSFRPICLGWGGLQMGILIRRIP
jgi:hypothetical protein